MFLRQKCRRIVGILIVCNSLYIAYYFYTTDAVNLEYFADHDYECPHIKQNSSLKHICFKDPHVFFVETSGSSTLTIRQACAVESTARHNPFMEIYVLMTSASTIEYDHDLIKRLSDIPNVHLVKVSIDGLVYNSPIFKWYRTGKWKKSKWKVSHLSDALRFLLIWKYGGIYLDLDIVTLRSLSNLRNCAVTENWDRVASGILFFEKEHVLIKKCMFDFANYYDPHNFVYNGPGIFTDNIKKICDTQVIGKVSGSNCDIDILPPEAAFPISYNKWEDYFVPSSVKNVSDFFNSSYLIHIWNKFSKKYKLKLGSNSLYELAVKQHCSSVYKYAKKIGFM